MSTLYVKILAAAALILAATTLRAQNAFRITGTVTDAATGQPVAGVVVKLTDAAGEIAAYDTTDDEGAYTILRTRKPEEGYTLVFSMLDTPHAPSPLRTGPPPRMPSWRPPQRPYAKSW